MKRLFVIILFLGISNFLFSELTRTITLDSTQVGNLRLAVTNGSTGYDAAMDQYYDKINPGSTVMKLKILHFGVMILYVMNLLVK